MYLIPQEIAQDIAMLADLKYPEMIRLFSAETEEAAEEIEMKIRQEVTSRTGLKQVGRAMSVFAPLLLEHKAITWYINKTQDYSLRRVAPEILTAEEAALIAQMDIRLSEEEFDALVVELRAAQKKLHKSKGSALDSSPLNLQSHMSKEVIPRQAYFTVERSKLLGLLKLLKAGAKRRQQVQCELTLKDRKATFVTPGTQFEVEVESMNTAKVTFDLLLFGQIISSYRDEIIRIEIFDDVMKINAFRFKTHTTFFDDDRILRSIRLPVNYKDLDLISLKRSQLYTEEELRFNQLSDKVNQAEDRLKKNVDDVWRRLIEYEVSKEVLVNLINARIDAHIDLMKRDSHFTT